MGLALTCQTMYNVKSNYYSGPALHLLCVHVCTRSWAILVQFVLTDVSALTYSCCQYMSVCSHAKMVLGRWSRAMSCVCSKPRTMASVQSDKVKCDASCHMAFKDPPISLKFTRDPFSDGSVLDLAVLLLWAIASLGNDICNYKAVCMHWTTTLILMSLQCSHGVWILCEHHVDEQALACIMQPVRSFS